MRRVHVLEFEDEPWFPSWLRTCMTNVIVAFTRAFGVVPVLAKLVDRALRESDNTQIVDLGSGAGGVMPDVLEELRAPDSSRELSLVMTDLYPNLDAIERFKGGDPKLRYETASVDASSLASAPTGVKTMVNCFHHMRPQQARAILESAATTRQPLLVYEMGERALPFPLWVALLPISLPLVFVSVWFLTPQVRPLTFRQVFFTYLCPVIPLFYAWDGQASMPRMYDEDDLNELLEGLQRPDYRWEMGKALTTDGKKRGLYLLGLPTEDTP